MWTIGDIEILQEPWEPSSMMYVQYTYVQCSLRLKDAMGTE